MQFWVFIKCLAATFVIASVLGTYWVLEEFNSPLLREGPAESTIVAAQETAIQKKMEQGQLTDIEPGANAFEHVKDLLINGKMDEAEAKMKYIVSFYPASSAAEASRKILGEMNLDRLLAPHDKPVVEVKPGDTYYKICNANKTSFDNLIYLNKLRRATSLQAGAKLKVMPLNNSLVVNLRTGWLELLDSDGQFLKNYAIIDARYDSRKGKYKNSVDATGGYANDRRVAKHGDDYRASIKRISLAKHALEIRSQLEDTDPEDTGIFIANEDIEELMLLLRAGNAVQVVYPE